MSNVAEKWIQRVHPQHGRLHRQLGIPEGHRIPTVLLEQIKNTPIGGHVHGVPVTMRLKRRALFALNVR